MSFTIEPCERLLSLFAADPKPVLLIGAGASVKSGIPLSADIVELAGKWAYCQQHGRYRDDPSVVRSDWFKWLQSHSWWTSNNPQDHYSEVIEYLLHPRQNRKDFFIHITRPQVPPSTGYERMLEIIASGRIDTVLTTNFDTVLVDLHRARKRPHIIEIIQTESDLTKFSTWPKYPQVIYLHGSVEHYSDANLIKEVQQLHPGLVARLSPLLRDHPLVVIGYRGAEPSVMRHLLAEQLQAAEGYRHGIYWCVMGQPTENDLHPLIRQLADLIPGNFQLISIPNFDALMEKLTAVIKASTPLRSINHSEHRQDSAESLSELPFHMRPVPDSNIHELDLATIQLELPQYCKTLGMRVPDSNTLEAWAEPLLRMDLLTRFRATEVPTVAGYLLLAKDPQRLFPQAVVKIRSPHQQSFTITGNLFQQLRRLLPIFDDVNIPYRLKDVVSEIVYPYPRLAVKELLVNALVHREYESDASIDIEIEESFIRLLNPGGLITQVQQQAGNNLQARIEQGIRGIKGYRNPVIADLFYGSGAMDKEGSGLPDVHEEVTKNKGRVLFGPADERNESFRAIVYRRPEIVDPKTKTARSPEARTPFYLNLLKVVDSPTEIWQANTKAKTFQEFSQALKGRKAVPHARRKDGVLFSFADLQKKKTGLSTLILPSTIQVTDSEEFCGESSGSAAYVWLLNEALYALLTKRGLVVDRYRKRAYFPRTNEGAREITYQASFRKATRTVTKPYLSKANQKVLYWEHEAIWFGFERFGTEWALRILPGYVFTNDGREELLYYKRIAVLATRRAARDFNIQVYNDLVFWTWVLSGGRPEWDLDTGMEMPINLKGTLESCDLEPLIPVEEPRTNGSAIFIPEQSRNELVEDT